MGNSEDTESFLVSLSHLSPTQVEAFKRAWAEPSALTHLLPGTGVVHFREYSGMSHEQASREAERVLATIGWYKGIERLQALALIMRVVSERE
jgi:hypothetical protein